MSTGKDISKILFTESWLLSSLFRVYPSIADTVQLYFIQSKIKNDWKEKDVPPRKQNIQLLLEFCISLTFSL
jgi:hypothetical protein